MSTLATYATSVAFQIASLLLLFFVFFYIYEPQFQAHVDQRISHLRQSVNETQTSRSVAEEEIDDRHASIVRHCKPPRGSRRVVGESDLFQWRGRILCAPECSCCC